MHLSNKISAGISAIRQEWSFAGIIHARGYCTIFSCICPLSWAVTGVHAHIFSCQPTIATVIARWQSIHTCYQCDQDYSNDIWKKMRTILSGLLQWNLKHKFVKLFLKNKHRTSNHYGALFTLANVFVTLIIYYYIKHLRNG